MSMTDPIADFLTRIRNGTAARQREVDIPFSNVKEGLAEILVKEGYIRSAKSVTIKSKPILRVYLKYGPEGEQVITGLSRVSKPGSRVYVSAAEIPQVIGGLGVNILSTSQGLMTGSQSKEKGIGGEILCEVW